MRPSTEARLAGLDSYGENQLIVGTDIGEIFLAEPESPVIHTKNDAKVTSIISVSSTLSLVFTERINGRRSATAYSSPVLQPIAGLTLHEVFAGALLSAKLQTVAVLSPAAIRLLRFDVRNSPKAENLKTIELKGCQCCCASESSDHTLLVATESEYQLLDLNTGSRSPLFPITPSVYPLMARLGQDFIVVQGTGPNDPAMGLFVDVKGEVARQGAVLQWPLYPSSLAASADHIFGVANDNLVVHRYNDSKATIEEVVIDIGKPASSKRVIRVFNLSYPIKVSSDELLSRLGDPGISFVETEIAFVLEDNEIRPWKPTPRLLVLEKEIDENKLFTVEPDARFSNSEQGIAELKYLSSYLTLHLLDENKIAEATKEWRSGAQLDIKLVLYAYNVEETLPVDTFPGLRSIAESLRKKSTEGKLNTSFLINGLRQAIKKARRSGSLDTKKFELLLAKLLYNSSRGENGLIRLLLEKDLVSKKEILDWMYQEGYLDLLERYYNLSGDAQSLFELHLKVFRSTRFPDSTVRRAAESLLVPEAIEAVATSQQLDMWELIVEVINDDRVNSELGLRLLTWPGFRSSYSESEILQALKEQSNSGEAWRGYLKHLVHDKGMFEGDLVTLLIADIVSLVESSSVRSQLSTSYATFAKAEWPKLKYRDWLLSSLKRKKITYSSELLALQKELWDLMKNELDWVQLMSTFDSILHDFKAERALVYKKLGLHEQALELMASIEDFRSMIDYASQFKDEPPTEQGLIMLTLRILLRNQKDFSGSRDAVLGYKILKDFLSVSCRLSEVSSVLKLLEDSTPFWVVADFVSGKLKKSLADEKGARVFYTAAKSATQVESLQSKKPKPPA